MQQGNVEQPHESKTGHDHLIYIHIYIHIPICIYYPATPHLSWNLKVLPSQIATHANTQGGVSSENDLLVPSVPSSSDRVSGTPRKKRLTRPGLPVLSIGLGIHVSLFIQSSFLLLPAAASPRHGLHAPHRLRMRPHPHTLTYTYIHAHIMYVCMHVCI
ncbi:hypothetical protein GGR51DRAFT_104204 [Nemania sp. FL0031]|nr:hypothetical protein GGR51DRAFT_104204 [Nemania sp. FL0031]